MSWKYRVVRRNVGTAEFPEYSYGVHEAYYSGGVVVSITEEPMDPSGEIAEELFDDIQLMLEALYEPVLDYETMKEI